MLTAEFKVSCSLKLFIIFAIDAQQFQPKQAD